MSPVVAKASDLAVGRMASYEVGGVTVAVAHGEGGFYAFGDACTHRGCSLAEGSLEETTVTCPCHGSRFDAATGAVQQGPAATALPSYPVRLDGDDLVVEVEAPAESQPAARQAVSALAQVPLFSALDAASLAGIESFAFRRAFSPGDLIVEEGHTANGLYIVLSGSVEVVKGLGGARPQVVAKLGPGEPFGEMALLGEWKRNASVRALEPTECLGLDRWIFLAHLRKDPELAIKLIQLLAQRLADTNQRLLEE